MASNPGSALFQINFKLSLFAGVIILLSHASSLTQAVALKDTGRVIKSGSASTQLPNQPGTLFGHDANGNGITLGNWLDYGSLLVGVAMAGTLYLIALAIIPVYYALFVVTHPTEVHGRSHDELDNNVTTVESEVLAPSHPASAGVGSASWNFARVLKMLTLAFETYQQLDMKEMDCQKRLICEVQDGKDFAASTARALSNVLLYFDFFKRYPHVEEYREAIRSGQRRMTSRSNEDTCSIQYAKCKFSLREFNDKYRRLLRSM